MASPTAPGFPCVSWTPRHAAPLLRALPPAARATPGDATPLLPLLQPAAHSTALLHPRQEHARLCPGEAATLLRTLHAAARATARDATTMLRPRHPAALPPPPQPTSLLLPGATRRPLEAARSLPPAPPPAVEGAGPALLSPGAAARWPRHRPGLPPHLRLLEHQLPHDNFCTTCRREVASWTLSPRN